MEGWDFSIQIFSQTKKQKVQIQIQIQIDLPLLFFFLHILMDPVIDNRWMIS